MTNKHLTCNECILKDITIFKTCKEPELNYIFQNKNYEEFKSNDELIKQNTPFKNIICIQEGIVKLFKTSKKQEEFILGFAQAGDILGLDAYVNKENYSFSAIVIQPAKVCIISEQVLTSIIKRQPDITIEIMKNLCGKIDTMETRVTSLAQKGVKEQLAEVLILLSPNNKVTNKVVQINYTIKDLANIIGTTKNYIYKILSDFSQHKIISIENKKIKIIDNVGLSKIASGH